MTFKVTTNEDSGNGMLVIDEDRVFAIIGVAWSTKGGHNSIAPFIASLEIFDR